MQVSKTPKQHLPSGSQALIKWAEEHGFGPVTSYTSTPVANHFSLRLRQPGKLKRSIKKQIPVHNLPSPKIQWKESAQFGGKTMYKK